MQEREVRGNGPFEGPSGSGEWVTGHKLDVDAGKKYTGRNWTE
jgi:hypothetical protein